MRGVGLDYEELDNGHFSISSYDGSGWPEIPDDEDDEREDEDQFTEQLAAHLAEGSVAILMEISNDGRRSVACVS